MTQEETIKSAVDELKVAYSDIKKAKGITGLINTVPKVVQKVEDIAATLNLHGSDKQQLAIDILLVVIPKPRWFPALFWNELLNLIINQVVAAFNGKYQWSKA